MSIDKDQHLYTTGRQVIQNFWTTCPGNPLVCDCEMRWYKRWYHDGWQVVSCSTRLSSKGQSCECVSWQIQVLLELDGRPKALESTTYFCVDVLRSQNFPQDVDEDHIKNTSCTDPTDHQEHPIHKVFHCLSYLSFNRKEKEQLNKISDNFRQWRWT